MQILNLIAAVTAIRYLGRDTIAYQRMNPDESIRSNNQRYELVMQADGNLVLYDRHDNSRVLWATNTENNQGAYLEAQQDGNLVVYTPNGRVLWALNTSGRPECQLTLKNEGALVFTSRARYRWCAGPGCDGLMRFCQFNVCDKICRLPSTPPGQIGFCFSNCHASCNKCGEPHCIQ